MAVVAVILLATGTLAFSLVTIGTAAAYADSVFARELRIQAGLNVRACLDTAALMISKDLFMNGTTTVKAFGCDIFVENPMQPGIVSVHAVSVLNGVRAYGEEQIYVSTNSVRVI